MKTERQKLHDKMQQLDINIRRFNVRMGNARAFFRCGNTGESKEILWYAKRNLMYVILEINRICDVMEKNPRVERPIEVEEARQRLAEQMELM